MHTLRYKCLLVPRDSMIADVLTKRHGNSVTMLKFFDTGCLSIVHEEEELPNRHNYLGKNMVVTCGCTDSTKTEPDGRPMPNNGRQLDVQKRFRKNQNGRPACQPYVPRVSLEGLEESPHSANQGGLQLLVFQLLYLLCCLSRWPCVTSCFRSEVSSFRDERSNRCRILRRIQMSPFSFRGIFAHCFH